MKKYFQGENNFTASGVWYIGKENKFFMVLVWMVGNRK